MFLFSYTSTVKITTLQNILKSISIYKGKQKFNLSHKIYNYIRPKVSIMVKTINVVCHYYILYIIGLVICGIYFSVYSLPYLIRRN